MLRTNCGSEAPQRSVNVVVQRKAAILYLKINAHIMDEELKPGTAPLKAIPMLNRKERELEAEKIRQEFVESKKLMIPPVIVRKTKTNNFEK